MTKIDWTKPIEFVTPNGMTCGYAGHIRDGVMVRWSNGDRITYHDNGVPVYQSAVYAIRNVVRSEYGPEIEPRRLTRCDGFVWFTDHWRFGGHWQREMRIDDLYFYGSKPWTMGLGYYNGLRHWHNPMSPGEREAGEKWFNRPWERPAERTMMDFYKAVVAPYGNGTCPQAGYDELRPPLDTVKPITWPPQQDWVAIIGGEG